MPRNSKATIDTLPAAVADSATTAPKKRAAPKKPAAKKPAVSPAKTAAARTKKTAPPAPLAGTTPKRAAKSNGTSPAARRNQTAVFDATAYHDDIARLAYHFWEQRVDEEGSPEADWLRAEQEWRRTVRMESA